MVLKNTDTLGIIMCLPKMHDIYRQTTILSFLSLHGCNAKKIAMLHSPPLCMYCKKVEFCLKPLSLAPMILLCVVAKLCKVHRAWQILASMLHRRDTASSGQCVQKYAP